MASKADMTPEEREAKEQEEFSTGLNFFDKSFAYIWSSQGPSGSSLTLSRTTLKFWSTAGEKACIFIEANGSQEQQEAFGKSEGVRPSLQHGVGGSQRDVDRAAKDWKG